VENIGLRALWKGLSHRDIVWSPDILHFDWEEFDRLSAGIISVDSQLLASFAVVSKDYLNINVRFGYHFVVIDALFGTSPRDNYLSLRFKGGGASPDRKNLRVQFLARVLQEHGFENDFGGDTIDARHRAALSLRWRGNWRCWVSCSGSHGSWTRSLKIRRKSRPLSRNF